MKKTNKFLSIFLALMMIISIIPMSSITVSAEETTTSGTCGENLTWTFDDSTGTLTISGTGEMYDLLDYESYEYPWELIKENIESVIIGDGVTTISNSAFYECFNITEVKMSDSVISIEPSAFYSCEKLTEIVLSENIESIGDNAFAWCSTLADIVLPDNLVTIGGNAFYFCCELTEIVIPDSVLYIHDEAFLDCWNLQTVEFGDNLLEIGSRAFEACNLTSVSIPDSVTDIGSGAFTRCPLTSIDVKPSNACYSNDEYGVLFNKDMTTLIQYPNGNESKEYIIPDGVTTVGYSAFEGNFYVEIITVPDSVEMIEERAFNGIEHILTIEIPESVTYIGDEAFGQCGHLGNIDVDDKNQYYSSDEYGVLFNKDKTILMQYPRGNTRTKYSISDDVTMIAEGAFCLCSNLEVMTIGDNVKTIGDNAFYSCSNLSSVAFSDSITKIGAFAFAGTSLSSVVLGNSVTEIGYYAFCICTELTNVTIPDSVSTIDTGAFDSCDNLANVYYEGSEDGWNYVSIEDANEPLTNATIHYGMENALNGDANGNGEITVVDSQYALQYICGAEKPHNTYLAAADVNDDIYLTAFDARLISLYASGVIDNFNMIPGESDGSNYTVLAVRYNKEELKAGESLIITVDLPENTDITTLDFTFGYNDTLFDVVDWNTYNLFEEERVNDNLDGETYMFDITGDYLAQLSNIKYSGFSVDPVDAGGTVLQIELETSIDIAYVNQVSCNMWTVEATDTNYNYVDIDYTDIWDLEDDCEHIATTVIIPVSCTVDGMEYDVCETCGETLGNITVIPATGHTAGEWETVLEPTYEADGKKVQRCTVCDEVVSEKVIPMLVKVTVTDEDTGVSMDYNKDDYSGEVEIAVEESFDGTAFDVIDTSLNASQKFIYDITMTVDGEETQPNGSVTIKIPLPEGYDPNRSFVYHVDTETGKVEKMPATYENGYLVFETTHFSYYAVVEEFNYTFSIQTPSRTTIRNKDGIILHANVEGTAPAGSYIEWTASNNKFKTSEQDYGNSLKIISNNNGYTTFTATLYDANGAILATDSLEMRSKAGFFDKIGGFFRSLFGATKTYEY